MSQLVPKQLLVSTVRHSNENWCWNFTWLSPSTPRQINYADPLVETPSLELTSTNHVLAPEKLDQPKPRAYKRCRMQAPPLPLYDDAQVDAADRLAPYRTRVDEPCQIDMRHVVYMPIGGGRVPEIPGESLQEPKETLYMLYGHLRSPKREPDDTLFVVARRNTLTLYRLLDQGKSQELDSLSIAMSSSHTFARLSDVIEIPELSLLLVIEQYSGSVAAVRIVRHSGYALTVENVVRCRKWLAGWCLVKRANTVFELFLVSIDATIEVHEISRDPYAAIHSWALVA